MVYLSAWATLARMDGHDLHESRWTGDGRTQNATCCPHPCGAGQRSIRKVRGVAAPARAAVADAPLAYVIAAVPTLAAWSAQVTDEPHAPWLAHTSPNSPVDTTTNPHAPEAMFFALAQLQAEGSLYPNLSDVASTLQGLPPVRLHVALPRLLEAMQTVGQTRVPSFFVLEKIAKALLHIAFGDVTSTTATAGPLRTPERLTQEQHQALETILQNDTLWRYPGNMRSLFSPLGLPNERDVLQAFLARESE